ncbi:MAG: hypothetical protein M3P40_05540 [Actinomycetota bacterium]|nr:hypothetical protein [Actinomycetota bacterium]
MDIDHFTLVSDQHGHALDGLTAAQTSDTADSVMQRVDTALYAARFGP